MSAPVVWWMTTGEAGFRSQARGLVNALELEAEEKVIGLKAPWSLAPPALWRVTLKGVRPVLAPPWPDLIISCSRRAAKAAIAVRRASGGRTLAVHIQNPLAPLGEFDLVIAMRHDGIDGPNVMRIDTALHDVTAEKLVAAGEAWRERFAHLPRPLTGVLLGGSTRRHPFTAQKAQAMIEALNRLRGSDGGLVITASRRTPDEVKALFQQAFGADPRVLMWDGQGDNPYQGILALADQLAVTGDSVSMVSEAVATGRSVAVFDIGGGARHRKFLANLVQRGIVGLLDGSPVPQGSSAPINATPAAAERVRRLLQAKS